MKFKARELPSKAQLKRTLYYSAMLLCLETNVSWGDGTYFPESFQPNDQPSTHGEKPERVSKLIHRLKTKPAPLDIAETKPLAKVPSLPEEQPTQAPLDNKPLPLLAVTPHPKVQSIPEETSLSQELIAEKAPSLEEIAFAKVSEERSPLAILDAIQDPHMQQWVLFASATRGSKEGIVEIVSVHEDKGPISRGEDVKALLIQMGIAPEKLQVIHAKGDKSQVGKVYLYVKNKG